MISNSDKLNYIWSELIIEELVRNDIALFCISPGSRSTPLTAAVARNKEASKIAKIHFDERSAAFYALGFARAAGKPTVLICTSGTAAANYYPAITEASLEQIPLIILTADRPPELRDCRANQTIDQIKMYGAYVRWFFDMPCPDDNIDLSFVLTTIDQAVYRSKASYPGPVHINCMFREPFLPDNDILIEKYSLKINEWQNSSRPFTRYSNKQMIADDISVNEVADIINNSTNCLILAGRMEQAIDCRIILRTAEKINCPILPDIASNMRLGVNSGNVFAYYDLALESSPDIFKDVQTIITVGSGFTSKRLQRYFESSTAKNKIILCSNPERIDPTHSCTHRIDADITLFFQNLIGRIYQKEGNHKLTAVSSEIEKLIEQHLDKSDKLSEPLTARMISRLVPNSHCLFVASSRPIRDLDSFSSTHGNNVGVGCNRGVSGIDGTIASALGFSRGLNRPLVLLIGDLAMLHDLNSLALLKEHEYPVTIVVINNDGGGIFSFLSVSKQTDIFEKYFGTPHGLTFEQTATMFGCNYYQPVTKDDFVKNFESSVAHAENSIIEVKTDRCENINFHNNLLSLLSVKSKISYGS